MTQHDREHADLERRMGRQFAELRAMHPHTQYALVGHEHTPGGDAPWGWGREASPGETVHMDSDWDLGGESYSLANRHLVGNGHTIRNGTLLPGPDHIVENVYLSGLGLSDAKDDLVDAKLGGLGIWRHVTIGGAPDNGFVLWHHQGDNWAPSFLTIEDTLFLNERAQASTQQANHAMLIGSGPAGFRRQNHSRVSMRRTVFALEKSTGWHLDRHPIVGDEAWFHGVNNVSMDWNGDCIMVKRGARALIQEHYWNPEVLRQDTKLRYEDAGPDLEESDLGYDNPVELMTEALAAEIRAEAGVRSDG